MEASCSVIVGNLARRAHEEESFGLGLEIIGGAVPASRHVQVCPTVAHARLSSARARSPRSLARGVAAVVVVIVLALACGHRLDAEASVLDETLVQTETVEVVVSSGDSLWSIAESHGIEGLTTAQTVDALVAWNGLVDSTITPGQTLVVPA